MSEKQIPVSYVAHGENTSPIFCSNFSKGCGGMTVQSNELYPGPISLFGSAQLWKSILLQAIAEKRDWYYGDHAYFGRMKYYRITKNRFQHDGIGKPDYGRLKRFNIEIKNWKDYGHHIVICPPDQRFADLFGFSADAWLRHICYELRRFTNRRLIIRDRRNLDTIPPLEEHLRDSWALVTHMSNAAVESVLEGIPVFCTGECAGVTMGTSDLSKIETPERPDWREKWAATLAANQWTMDEMHRGECWRSIS